MHKWGDGKRKSADVKRKTVTLIYPDPLNSCLFLFSHKCQPSRYRRLYRTSPCQCWGSRRTLRWISPHQQSRRGHQGQKGTHANSRAILTTSNRLRCYNKYLMKWDSFTGGWKPTSLTSVFSVRTSVCVVPSGAKMDVHVDVWEVDFLPPFFHPLNSLLVVIRNLGFNRKAHIRYQCRKTTVLSCHIHLIHTDFEKMNNIKCGI